MLISNPNGKRLKHIGAIITPNHEGADQIETGSTAGLPEAIIPLMAWRQRITLLAGREKRAGKTTYCATAAAKLSSGRTHLGETLAPGTILWVLAEGHWDDIKRPMQHAGADLTRIRVQRQHGTDRLAQLAANIHDARPDVVFIDTLASFTDDTITNAAGSDHWTPILNRITRLAQDNNCAIVIIAHTRKDDEEVRDSTAITAAADMILRITEHRQPNARRIKAIGRWPIQAEHTIVLDDAEYRIEAEQQAPSSSRSSHEQKVRDYLAANPHASKYRTRKAVGGSNTTTDALYQQIRAEAGPKAGPKAR